MTKSHEEARAALMVQKQKYVQMGAAFRKAADDMAEACKQFTQAWQASVNRDRH